MASVLAMAFVLAVARGRGLAGNVYSQRRVWHRLGRVCDDHRAVGAEWSLERDLRRGHGDLHRLHLSFAQTDSGLEQRLGGAELSGALGDDGRAMARRAVDAVRLSSYLAAGLLVFATIMVALLLKLAYWRFIDTHPGASTAESATGLGFLGKVRLLEAPHTSENYLLKEMGFRIARKHAQKLRVIAACLGFPFAARTGDRRRCGVGRYRTDLLAARGSSCDGWCVDRTLVVLRRSQAHGYALLRPRAVIAG